MFKCRRSNRIDKHYSLDSMNKEIFDFLGKSSNVFDFFFLGVKSELM